MSADNMSRDIDLNMQHVNIDEFCEFIRDRIEMEEFEQPVLGLGKSGIGKTESIENAICKPLGIGLIEMRLGSYSETDLTGFPIPEVDKATGQTMMRFADVSKFPHEGRDKEVGILLLDEFTNARPAVRAAALQLTDKSRSIGDYKLPPKWLIVILGNGPSDGGYFQGLEYALMGRADCFRVDVSFRAWKNWALKNQIHPAVLGFIENYQKGPMAALHKHKDMDEAEYEEKDANPRCWVKLSTHLKKKEERLGHPLDDNQVTIYAGAAVGADMAPAFAAYYAYQKNMIPAADILSGAALNLDLKKYGIESLYMSATASAMSCADLLNAEEKAIRNEDGASPETNKKVDNMLAFALKLIDSGFTDIGSGMAETLNLATHKDLFKEYIQYVDDDVFDHLDQLADRCNGIGEVNVLLKRAKANA